MCCGELKGGTLEVMKKIGLALLSSKLSSDKVNVSNQLLVNVIPCIHNYSIIILNRLWNQQYRKHLLPLFNMLLLLMLCIRQKTHQITCEDILAPQARLHQSKDILCESPGLNW